MKPRRRRTEWDAKREGREGERQAEIAGESHRIKDREASIKRKRSIKIRDQ